MKSKIFFTVLVFLMLFFSCEKDKDNNSEPENNSPILKTISSDMIVANAGDTEYLQLSATDLDGDLITFEITKNPGFLSIKDFSQTGTKATVTLVMEPDISLRGPQADTIKITDGKGGFDEERFTIQISITLVTLYLCDWSELSESTHGPSGCWGASNTSYSTTFGGYYLTQDLVGTEYSFNLSCSCTSTREFSAYIKIGGTIVASAKFDVSGEEQEYYINVEGVDPDIKGEKEVELIVKINGEGPGVESDLCFNPWTYNSYITLPPIDKNSK